MNLSNSQYQLSKKFQLIPTILFTVVGIFIAIFLGVLYSIISSFSPLILLDIGLAVGMAWVLTTITSNLTKLAKVRNELVSFLMALIICLFAYYSATVTFELLIFDMDYEYWLDFFLSPVTVFDIIISDIIPNRVITITKGSSKSGLEISGILLGIVYLVELIVFLWPAAVALNMDDCFCEDCQKWYSKFNFYSASDDSLVTNINTCQSGHYADVLSQVVFYKNLNELVQQSEPTSEEITGLNYIYCQCPNCHERNLLSILKIKLKKNKKEYEAVTDSDSILVNNNYIDAKTDEIFQTQKRNLY
ncbi:MULTISPECIES: hypothetical protein [unclassified Gilliamella]|uniref:hypothetical protein n=1 Tax=unclassified Gilliamella TaxID=2685620 RepID=UPI00226A578D|nr:MULTISPECIES: hypothetical protein [unclassified Gilliamella]MCX8600859.1 hypothetical protein [Gilliamella sp. B3722]MCX8609016.1 hypothetical protein [Gilliamella sp. B3771]MCX8610079.1 hypothetical protein [Gilliamella sp. B3891]MCX8612661.1 hypothetical protein [Gilliamella sp. B3773]MCX8616140.1 hypothetical protein [Gilliamella sp. B3770]